MTKFIKTGMGLMVLSTFVLVPVASYAVSNTNLTGSVVADIEAGLDTSVGSDTSVKSDTDVNTGVEIDLNNKDTESNSDSEALLKVNSSGVAVVSSAQVGSESDLDIFSANVPAKNKEVAKVDIKSDEAGESEVKVVYRHKGKLLGFIPVTVKSTTVVEAKADTETEVRSGLSWWSFLVADENYAKADIESRIKNNTTVKINAQVSASAQAKARVAEAVIAEVAGSAIAQGSITAK